MKSISIYIHIPFCKKKCYYCDFISYSDRGEWIEKYIEALKKEIVLYRDELADYEIKSIFIGGGTPSILEVKQVADIMNSLCKHYRMKTDAEISLEANPGLLTRDKLRVYFDNGINRLSIGLQACQDYLLESIGRIHRYDDFLVNLEDARNSGFINLNVDLMFGLPGQTLEDWEDTLKKIVDLQIPHISSYSLIFEEGTPFHSWEMEGRIKRVEEEIELQMYHHAINYLQGKGYQHYEISNFAKEGYQCKHNITYWKNQSYLGFGAAAHSYLNKERFNNFSSLEKYIESIYHKEKPIENSTISSYHEEISETMFLGLRMMEGVSIKEFCKRFNLSPFDIYSKRLEKLKKQQLITWDSKTIKLTDKGIDLANVVFEEMLLD